MISLSADTRELQSLIKTIKVLPKGLQKATTRAINKSLTTTRAFMVRLVRQDYAVKAKDVRSVLTLRKASWNKLVGHVWGTGSPGVPLFAFVRGSKKTPSTRRLKSGAYRPAVGVSVVIRKLRGRTPAKGVFLAKMKSGHVGAFKRSGSVTRTGKQKIQEAFGPSPIRILSSDKYMDEVSDFADETFEKNLRHEAKFILRKYGLQ